MGNPHRRRPPPRAPERSPVLAALRHGGLPAALYVVDAFVTNHGMLAVVVAVGVLLGRGGAAVFASLRGTSSAVRGHVTSVVVYIGVALAVLGTNALQNELARGRADDIVAACEAFHRQHARYPARLDELVPAFLLRVPRAKLLMASDMGAFLYSSELRPSANGVPREAHSLSFLARPPSEASTYCFEQRRWTACE